MKNVVVKNLNFSYDKETEVLKDVSFEIEKGQYVSIVGHNGSGKSTLGKLLIGLLTPNGGEISICGLPLNKQNLQEIRNKVAIVFQNPDNQFIGATVEDDIAFSLENQNISRDLMPEMVKKVAKEVGMLDFLNKEPSYLSGGQKQRVAIADSLVRNPEILILDEATSMLDPSGKEEILRLILELREKNKDLTIISITHDIEEAFKSDHIVLIQDGVVVLSMPPKELFNSTDLIEKFNLDVPFEVKLKKALKEGGYKVDENSSLKEVGDILCRSK